jgi:UDP-N-acetylmuramoyl-tripeptide--D-alanyl-D-alanine ligase
MKIDLIEKILNIKKIGNGKKKLNNICIDSRKLKKNDTFVAIKGKNFDGNNFIKEALENGASGIILQKEFIKTYLEEINFHKKTWCVAVDDIKIALLKLAKHRRNLFNIPFIGITGSCGKTTIKEITGKILKKLKKNILITEKSQNGLLGLAITLLKLKKKNQFAICEVGISEIGEMQALSAALNPNIALISNISRAHMQGFNDSIDKIKEEKSILLKNLNKNDIAIINGDQKILDNIEISSKLIKFGLNENNNIKACNIKYLNKSIKFDLFIENKFINNFKINSINEGYLYSCLASISITYSLGLYDYKTIKQTISKKNIYPGRFFIYKNINTNRIIIDDAYNANPESMSKSIISFDMMKLNGNKAIIIGDMLEQGINANLYHKEIISLINESKTINEVVFIGKTINEIKEYCNKKYYFFENKDSAEKKILELINENNNLLFKGSNSIGLSKIISNLLKYLNLFPKYKSPYS